MDAILIFLALICVTLEAFSGIIGLQTKLKLGWLGLAFWFLSMVV